MKIAKGATFHYFLQNSYLIQSHNAYINGKSLSFIHESKSAKDKVFIGKEICLRINIFRNCLISQINVAKEITNINLQQHVCIKPCHRC